MIVLRIITGISTYAVMFYLISMIIGFNAVSIILSALISTIIASMPMKSLSDNGHNFWQQSTTIAKITLIVCVLGFTTMIFLPRLVTLFPEYVGNIVITGTNMGDDFKHLSVLNALAIGDIPPGNFVDPRENLIYYYLYYLVPASISNVIGVKATKLFVLFTVITTFLSVVQCYCTILQIKRHFKMIIPALALVFCCFAGGLEYIYLTAEEWAGITDKPLESSAVWFNGPYATAIWAPQHWFAFTVMLSIFYTVLKKFFASPTTKEKVVLTIWTAMQFAFIWGTSAYIGIILTGGLGIYLLMYFVHKLYTIGIRNTLPHLLPVTTGLVLGGLLILPLLLPMQTRNTLDLIKPFGQELFKSSIKTISYIYFLEMGILYPLGLLGVYGYLRKKTVKVKSETLMAFMSVAIFTFVIISIVRTMGLNDIALRGSLALQTTIFIFATAGIKYLHHILKRNYVVWTTAFLIIVLLLGVQINYSISEFSNRYKFKSSLMKNEYELLCWINDNIDRKERIWTYPHSEHISFFIKSVAMHYSFETKLHSIYFNDPKNKKEIERKIRIVDQCTSREQIKNALKELNVRYIIVTKDTQKIFSDKHYNYPYLFDMEKGENIYNPQLTLDVQLPASFNFENAVNYNQLFFPNAAYTISSLSEDAKEGKHALKVKLDNTGEGRMSRKLFIKKGNYKLSGWIKVLNIENDGLGAFVSLLGDKSTAVYVGKATNDWVYVEKSFVLNDDKETEICFGLGGWGHAKGEALFDDFVLELENTN